jgi:crotonobetainyl-CoA:carnitine CoA-transferase CaiB-like acyl-CoA transferase
VTVIGEDPVLAVRHRVGGAAAAALALVGDHAARRHLARGGSDQSVTVEVAEAAATLLGFVFQQVEGVDLTRHRNATIDQYLTGDGRWIHLHGGFPHLADGLLGLLGLGSESVEDRDAIAAAVQRWDGDGLEEAIAAAGLCGALVRSPAEWQRHPQGAHLAMLPAVTVERIGEGDPGPPVADADAARERPGPPRPLDDIRVLDQTRVLAGPTCGRTLASLGADVLRVSAPHLPSIDPFVIDTGHGVRHSLVDLRNAPGRAAVAALVRHCDVVVQSYRPGALDRYGAAVQDLVEMRPGVVVVQISCYGSTGPWAGRPGWEQLAQSVTGVSWDEGTGDGGAGDQVPSLLPAAATDYTTGYLAAAGAVHALRRRDTEGGSWLVRASLAQTAMWIQGAGLVSDPGAAAGLGDVAARMVTTPTAWGSLQHLPPALVLSATPCRWDRPPEPLGASQAAWD